MRVNGSLIVKWPGCKSSLEYGLIVFNFSVPQFPYPESRRCPALMVPEGSCHEVSGHVVEAYIARSCGQPLGAKGGFQKEMKASILKQQTNEIC